MGFALLSWSESTECLNRKGKYILFSFHLFSFQTGGASRAPWVHSASTHEKPGAANLLVGPVLFLFFYFCHCFSSLHWPYIFRQKVTAVTFCLTVSTSPFRCLARRPASIRRGFLFHPVAFSYLRKRIFPCVTDPIP